MGFPVGASGKESACQWRRYKKFRFHCWVRKIPWRRSWQPTPGFLPGDSHGQEESYIPEDGKESDMTEATEPANNGEKDGFFKKCSPFGFPACRFF